MGLPPFSQYRVCLRHLIVAGSYGQKYNIFWLFVVYEMLRNIPFFACLRHGPRGILLPFIASPSEMCYITGSMTCQGVRSPEKNSHSVDGRYAHHRCEEVCPAEGFLLSDASSTMYNTIPLSRAGIDEKDSGPEERP